MQLRTLSSTRSRGPGPHLSKLRCDRRTELHENSQPHATRLQRPSPSCTKNSRKPLLPMVVLLPKGKCLCRASILKYGSYGRVELKRSQHLSYLLKGIKGLSHRSPHKSFASSPVEPQVLDTLVWMPAGRGWYTGSSTRSTCSAACTSSRHRTSWPQCLPVKLLVQEPSPSDLVKFLAKCQHKDGG